MVSISFWSVIIILIYWVKNTINETRSDASTVKYLIKLSLSRENLSTCF
jgi:hypothetical protein